MHLLRRPAGVERPAYRRGGEAVDGGAAPGLHVGDQVQLGRQLGSPAGRERSRSGRPGPGCGRAARAAAAPARRRPRGSPSSSARPWRGHRAEPGDARASPPPRPTRPPAGPGTPAGAAAASGPAPPGTGPRCRRRAPGRPGARPAWSSASQRVSTRWGSTSPGERALSDLPAASREPTLPEVRGLASQARARSAHRSAAGLRPTRRTRRWAASSPAGRPARRRPGARRWPPARPRRRRSGRRRAAARPRRGGRGPRGHRCGAPPRAPSPSGPAAARPGVRRRRRRPRRPGRPARGRGWWSPAPGGTSTGPSPGSGTRPSSSDTTVSARSPAADSQTSAWSSSRIDGVGGPAGGRGRPVPRLRRAGFGPRRPGHVGGRARLGSGDRARAAPTRGSPHARRADRNPEEREWRDRDAGAAAGQAGARARRGPGPPGTGRFRSGSHRPSRQRY